MDDRKHVDSMVGSRPYPADDPKSYELLTQVYHQCEMCKIGIASLTHISQVECPIYDGYWEKRADEKTFLEREHQIELFTFSKSRSIPSRI